MGSLQIPSSPDKWDQCVNKCDDLVYTDHKCIPANPLYPHYWPNISQALPLRRDYSAEE